MLNHEHLIWRDVLDVVVEIENFGKMFFTYTKSSLLWGIVHSIWLWLCLSNKKIYQFNIKMVQAWIFLNISVTEHRASTSLSHIPTSRNLFLFAIILGFNIMLEFRDRWFWSGTFQISPDFFLFSYLFNLLIHLLIKIRKLQRKSFKLASDSQTPRKSLKLISF